MKLSLSKNDLKAYIAAQLNNIFPEKRRVILNDVSWFDIAVDRLDNCFKKVAFDRYNSGNQTFLNHLYSDHYLMFLWFLANTCWSESNDDRLASKFYYLNKALHAFDCMYDTALPDVFLVFHGTGTMLGKASYSDYFVALQGCTVGSHKGKYPVLGKGVSLTAHSSIVGDCSIGDRVSVSVHTTVFQRNVNSDTLLYNSHGEVLEKKSKVPYAQQFFIVDLKTV